MCDLNIERAGPRGNPRGGPTLVLIHPMGADIRFWDACRRDWEERFDCLAVDLPAAGTSPDPGGTLTLRRQAEILQSTLAKQDLKQIVPVGCAVGAMIAVELAALLQESASGLVLANPGLATGREARAALSARAAAVRSGGMAAVMPDAVALAFDGQPHDESFQAYAERFAAQDPVRYARQIEGMLDADITQALSTVRCPSFVVVGGHDRLLPPEIGRTVASKLGDCTFAEYREAAHFIPWQASQRFSRDVEAWIGSAVLTDRD